MACKYLFCRRYNESVVALPRISEQVPQDRSKNAHGHDTVLDRLEAKIIKHISKLQFDQQMRYGGIISAHF